MKLTTAMPLLLISLVVDAAPALQGVDISTPALVVPSLSIATSNDAIRRRSASRFSCGQYKFDDGTVQEFYSQVWAGLPADRMICRHFKYEFRDKKGQEGKMVDAKVDLGCTCFFYEQPCNPSEGYAETWTGWNGWDNYASTDKNFKGWYCFEQS